MEDAVVYQMVKNYVFACQEVFWKKAKPNSFITKTVGVQALFDILRLLAAEAYETKVISSSAFANKLRGAAGIDFSEDQFRNASGSGRSLIRRAIERRAGIVRK